MFFFSLFSVFLFFFFLSVSIFFSNFFLIKKTFLPTHLPAFPRNMTLLWIQVFHWLISFVGVIDLVAKSSAGQGIETKM